MRRGFFLGKFLPPHNGHLFVCDVACQMVDHLTVFVCSHEAEPIDGFLRAGWMRDCLAGKNCTVVHMHRDIPQAPEEHPAFWSIWKDAIFEHHPDPIDIVFGSETYIHQLAGVLEASPFVVDVARKTVPISATAIRADPVANWAFLPPPVRTHYQKRVTLIGPESTGKSTLAESLSDHFEAAVITEYGRTYQADFKQGADWGAADFLAIAERHRALAMATAKRAGALVIEDTDLLQTVVWAEALTGEVPAQLVEQLMQAEPPDLYLLLSPDCAWINDGTRYHATRTQRVWFHEKLLYWFEKTGATCQHITGESWANRAQDAQDAVQNLLDASSSLTQRRGARPQLP